MAESENNEMMEQLRRVLATDRPPDGLVQAAKDSFTWRTVDDELAELLADSAAEELVGLRSVDAPRTLEFGVGDLSIALEIVETGATVELRGQLSPTDVTELTIESTSGNTHSSVVAVDEDGWFSASLPATGIVRLRAGSIVTDWFSL